MTAPTAAEMIPIVMTMMAVISMTSATSFAREKSPICVVTPSVGIVVNMVRNPEEDEPNRRASLPTVQKLPDQTAHIGCASVRAAARTRVADRQSKKSSFAATITPRAHTDSMRRLLRHVRVVARRIAPGDRLVDGWLDRRTLDAYT